MKFVQELGNPTGWHDCHRLVCIRDDGVRVESGWAKLAAPAILQDAQIESNNKVYAEHPLGGYLCFNEDDWDGMPRVVRFDWQESSSVPVECKTGFDLIGSGVEVDSDTDEDEANDEEFALGAVKTPVSVEDSPDITEDGEFVNVRKPTMTITQLKRRPVDIGRFTIRNDLDKIPDGPESSAARLRYLEQHDESEGGTPD